MQYTTKQKTDIGQAIADTFKIPKGRNGLYKTEWGEMTELGLFEMFVAVAENIEDHSILNLID